MVENNKYSRQHIANLYGIGKSTVHDIHKRRDQIRRFSMNNSIDSSKRRRVNVGIADELNSDDPIHDIFEMKEGDIILKEEELVGQIEEFEEDIQQPQFEIVYEGQVIESPEQTFEKNEKQDKRRSNTLTIRQKYEILMKLEEGISVPTICKEYFIGRTTVYDFIKRKQEIIEYIEKSSDETRKTFKKSNYPEVEANMIEWCEDSEIYSKHQFFEECKRNFSRISTSSQFCGSWSWCKRFFDRHPQFKSKLVNNEGEPLDKSEFSISKGEKMLLKIIEI